MCHTIRQVPQEKQSRQLCKTDINVDDNSKSHAVAVRNIVLWTAAVWTVGHSLDNEKQQQPNKRRQQRAEYLYTVEVSQSAYPVS